MKNTVEYIANEAGQRTAVVVSYAEWEKMRQKLSRLQQKVRVLQGIRNGLREVKAAGERNEPLQSLQAFLDES
ncbi:hypothetical protein SAMN02745146_3517 [Hymenobacter daecheongensis DSM 21074]|uniref:Antitoxin n=1 Tax=Hymenobacter daecheongensis DSM 21074 TaxID=1121955 RepID=A0A1M6KPF4_9BACT|nr:hypothetical protein [Hymenobacter daecheongensis]SHJ60883.1 hypothetical protein SAMN02745146_3517 [Hymenobacter daecheongensis DSM 21074]